jgi:hypothetical protein
MPRTRRTFTDEFKREAVKLVKQPGAMVTHIAKDLGIEQSVLRRWVTAILPCPRLNRGACLCNPSKSPSIQQLGIAPRHKSYQCNHDAYTQYEDFHSSHVMF